MLNLCNVNEIKPLLAEYGFHFSKAKGQNFLTAEWVPRRIAEEAGVDRGAGVLEIGPVRDRLLFGTRGAVLCVHCRKPDGRLPSLRSCLRSRNFARFVIFTKNPR